MALNERRIAVLGAGKIGEALIAGLISSGWRSPTDIVASSRRAERVTELAERHGVVATLSNAEAVAGAALVVIAVKPQDIEGLLGEIGTLITRPEQTVLSVAAAIPTAAIERHLASGVPVVRAMPNTPSVVHEGIAGLCAGAHADDAHVTLAEERSLASRRRRPRRRGRAWTPSPPSPAPGPAYFALLAEAMIEAGILLGLSREVSTQLVVQTMLGTAKQLRDMKMHPVELREMVTSPGGTTIAAIRELEIAGVRAAFLNAIQAAMVRARELAVGELAPRQERRRELDGEPRSAASACRARTASATLVSSRKSLARLEVDEQRAERPTRTLPGHAPRARRASPRRRGESHPRPRTSSLSQPACSSSPRTRAGERGAVATDPALRLGCTGSEGPLGVGTSAGEVARDEAGLQCSERPSPALRRGVVPAPPISLRGAQQPVRAPRRRSQP